MKYIYAFALLTYSLFVMGNDLEGHFSHYTFPFKQGDTVWKNFKTPQERISALQIPIDTLALMSTEELIYACIDYPYLLDVFAYDNINMGFEAMTSKFNGFQELLTRPDLTEELMDVFSHISTRNFFIRSDSSIEIGENSMKIYVLSYLLGSKQIFTRMNSSQKDYLLQLTQNNIKTLSKFSDYSQSLGSSALLSLKHLLTGSLKNMTNSDYLPVTRYTPNGSPVQAWKLIQNELSNSEKTAFENYVINNYNAIVISEATKSYNCHAYAWHIYDGGDSVWIGLSSFTDENIYWEDNSYIEVPESIAMKVSYYETIANHSAIRITSNLYRSKWGMMPLVEHAPYSCPYDASLPRKYYIRPVIIGSSELYGTSDYSIQDLPDYYDISWNLTGNNSSNFVLQQLDNHCIINRKQNANFSGSANLTLIVQVFHAGEVICTVSKPLVAPYISGPTVPCGVSTYFVHPYLEGKTVEWQASGQNLNYYNQQGGQQTYDNSYVINPNNTDYVEGTLTATIKMDNNILGILEKNIDSSDGFSGTWYQQPTTNDTINSTPKHFQNQSRLKFVPGRKIYLQSDHFIDTNINYTQNGFYIWSWSNSNGVISFTPSTPLNSTSGDITIDGTALTGCRKFHFMMVPLYDFIDNPILYMKSEGDTYVFSLNQDEQLWRNTAIKHIGSVEWKIVIIKINTGEKVFEDLAKNSYKSINLSSFPTGLYLAIAIINDQYCSLKFSINR